MIPTKSCKNIESLRNEAIGPDIVQDRAVLVLGYYEAGDGGGGTFRWDPTSSDPDNNGTTIKPHQVGNADLGRWLRVYDGPVSVKFFGAYCDGTHPSQTYEAIQAAIDFATNPLTVHSAAVVRFPARSRTDHGDIAEYAVDDKIVLPRLPYSSW